MTVWQLSHQFSRATSCSTRLKNHPEKNKTIYSDNNIFLKIRLIAWKLEGYINSLTWFFGLFFQFRHESKWLNWVRKKKTFWYLAWYHKIIAQRKSNTFSKIKCSKIFRIMSFLLKHLTRTIKSNVNWRFDVTNIILKIEVVNVKVVM